MELAEQNNILLIFSLTFVSPEVQVRAFLLGSMHAYLVLTRKITMTERGHSNWPGVTEQFPFFTLESILETLQRLLAISSLGH